MDWLLRFLSSSIGRKVQVALTGLLLCGFLVAHLGGNLLLYSGRETFNHYAENLKRTPLLPLLEAGLAALFLLHIVTALRLRWEKRAARPVPYESRACAGGRTWGSATMAFSGLLLLAFLIVHIKTLRLAPDKSDLYAVVLSAFRNPWYALFYVIAMGGLALHLSHGFQSGFQTLGLNHPKYTPLIRRAGLAFALLVAGGFASLALWAGFLHR